MHPLTSTRLVVLECCLLSRQAGAKKVYAGMRSLSIRGGIDAYKVENAACVTTCVVVWLMGAVEASNMARSAETLVKANRMEGRIVIINNIGTSAALTKRGGRCPVWDVEGRARGAHSHACLSGWVCSGGDGAAREGGHHHLGAHRLPARAREDARDLRARQGEVRGGPAVGTC